MWRSIVSINEGVVQALSCEDTMARSRADTNHRLIVDLSWRVQALEKALDTACEALANRTRDDDG